MINLKEIPTNPGIYIYKDEFGKIIYIGKAKNLKNRVSSYFTNSKSLNIKTRVLVKNISKLEFIVVDNEIEALLLENKLIKKYLPKYNINLKDDKTYAYIKLSNQKVPKIFSTRIVKSNGDYFGPFSDGNLRKDLIELVISIFQIITPKTFSNRSTLNFEIGKSPTNSIENLDLENYLKKVSMAKDFLNGKNIPKLLKKLKTEMEAFAEINKFELAIERREQINLIKKVFAKKQSVDLLKTYNQDVISVFFDKISGKGIIVVLNIEKGVISQKNEFRFDFVLDILDDFSLLEDFIKMYYSKNYPTREILVSDKFWKTDLDRENIENYLKKLSKSNSKIYCPIRGAKKKLVELGLKNAKIAFKNNVLEEMRVKLKLPKVPNIIECFDMSNLGHDFLVGGMTRWTFGNEDKSGHRKFEIKSFKGKQDDFRAMSEVVYRRYKRLKDKGEELPDLIIIDGGKGQLSSAISSLRNLKIKIPIISLAKKEEEIFIISQKESLRFNKNSKMMLFIRKVRNSVHNYVISYNRKKREMKTKSEIEY